MAKLIRQVGSTCRGSFGNVLENLLVLSVRCSKTRGRLMSYFTSCTGGARLCKYSGDSPCLNLKKCVKHMYHLLRYSYSQPSSS